MENTKIMVKLNGIDVVKNFVNVASGVDADLDLVSGRYVVDAKSIMGIFSLNLSKPIEMVIHSIDPAIVQKFDSFRF